MKIKVSNVNIPNWKEVTVKSRIPVELEKLSEIARNIWWAWNFEATELFRDLDPELWKECGQNPVLLLERMSYEKLEALTKDKVILRRMNEVYTKFRDYMDVKPDSQRPSVAYFSMEYGLSSVLKIYSGGLGVLAGDYLKEASDSNVDLCAVGFLYRYGYFTQTLSMDGQQIANYEAQNFGQLPIDRVLDADGKPLVVDVPYLDYYVHANVWRVNVGRISLYLLDTDNEMNSEFDRPITHQLYGGDWENRLKQEILLGIGGILTLKALGIKKDIYHCNEGHAALINVQRICDYVATGLTFNQAIELVRASSLYTVHTPVPAGHDYFDEGLFGKYMGGYPAKMGITWDDLMDLGRNNAGDKGERFCMSVFACNTSQEVNGVSWLHGKVSQEMFSSIWKGYFPEESHVGYVTNGVHFPTWSATEWKKLYFKYFNENFWFDQSNPKIWEAIYNVPDEEIWQTRMTMKNKLVDYIRKSFRDTWLKNQGDPSRIVSLMDKINPNALLIGFGRRFATYKRAHLLFTDLERLSKIVNNPDYPVQFLFTGKAHPHDGAGQGLIKRIIEISRRPEFLGKIIFLENYDMQLARRLVSGVDIWLNTPTRPLEASGTSGEKALMNGVVNFSVLDGWWLEGYREGAGWALTEKRTYQNQEHQDQLDAATIYIIASMFGTETSKAYGTIYALLTLSVSVFALTSLDTGTRLSRFMFSELFLKEGEATYKDAKGARKVLAHPLFGTVSMVLIGCILGGLSLSQIWGLFGAANQLLAGIALMAVAAWLGEVGKNNKMFYFPMVFMLAATLTSLVITVINKCKAIGAGTAAWGDWFQLFFATAMAVLAIFLVVEGAQTFAKQMKEKKAKKAA